MSKKLSELNYNPKPMFYAANLEKLRHIAAQCGYALAIHGSLNHDLDLIAVRWAECYESPLYLVERFIEEVVDCSWQRNFYEDSIELTEPELRYGNQLHYTIPIIGDFFIDLTVITNE